MREQEVQLAGSNSVFVLVAVLFGAEGDGVSWRAPGGARGQLYRTIGAAYNAAWLANAEAAVEAGLPSTYRGEDWESNGYGH
jgi:hypothetical protein